jgi:hypothetical protein
MKGLSRLKSIITAANDQIRLQRYYCKPIPKESCNLDNPIVKDNVVDLVVIAFNRPDLIELQYQFLSKNFKATFTYTVADNSNDPKAKIAIRSYCLKNDIPYLCLPSNPFKAPRFSESHGSALNYVYRKYLKKKSTVVGLLDHDIFPIDSFDIGDILKNQPFYGMLQEYQNSALPNGKLYYLWPGLAFFRRSCLEGINVDFMPKLKGDTGSALFKSLYMTFIQDFNNPNGFKFATENRKSLWEGNDFQSDMYAVVGETWLHIANAGSWKKTPKDKLKKERMEQILQNLLNI